MICDNLSVSKEGHLLFAGQDTVELAKKYGTPVYLMDEDKTIAVAGTDIVKADGKHQNPLREPYFLEEVFWRKLGAQRKKLNTMSIREKRVRLS